MTQIELTKGGLKFKPSNMIGTGRTFNYQGMVDKAQDMIYIACDIIDFPQIKVIFKEGMDLVREYPDGEIKKSQREVLFS